jgi:hypothetical protein
VYRDCVDESSSCGLKCGNKTEISAAVCVGLLNACSVDLYGFDVSPTVEVAEADGTKSTSAVSVLTNKSSVASGADGAIG